MARMLRMTRADRRARSAFLFTGGVAGAVALGVFAAGLVPTHSGAGGAPDSLARYHSDGAHESSLAAGNSYYIESGPQDTTPQSGGVMADGYYASAYPFAGRDGGPVQAGMDDMGAIPLDPSLAALSDETPEAMMSDEESDGVERGAEHGAAGEAAIAAAAVAHAVQSAEAGLKPIALPSDAPPGTSAL